MTRKPPIDGANHPAAWNATKALPACYPRFVSIRKGELGRNEAKRLLRKGKPRKQWPTLGGRG